MLQREKCENIGRCLSLVITYGSECNLNRMNWIYNIAQVIDSEEILIQLVEYTRGGT